MVTHVLVMFAVILSLLLVVSFFNFLEFQVRQCLFGCLLGVFLSVRICYWSSIHVHPIQLHDMHPHHCPVLVSEGPVVDIKDIAMPQSS
jgi:hypothetical protein